MELILFILLLIVSALTYLILASNAYSPEDRWKSYTDADNGSYIFGSIIRGDWDKYDASFTWTCITNFILGINLCNLGYIWYEGIIEFDIIALAITLPAYYLIGLFSILIIDRIWIDKYMAVNNGPSMMYPIQGLLATYGTQSIGSTIFRIMYWPICSLIEFTIYLRMKLSASIFMNYIKRNRYNRLLEHTIEDTKFIELELSDLLRTNSSSYTQLRIDDKYCPSFEDYHTWRTLPINRWIFTQYIKAGLELGEFRSFNDHYKNYVKNLYIEYVTKTKSTNATIDQYNTSLS